LTELNADKRVELKEQKDRLKAAQKFLQEAADLESAQALAKQQADYDALKTAYDTFTATYQALLAQETSGDIVEGTPEFDTLIEMEN
jgi:hypothetical protein